MQNFAKNVKPIKCNLTRKHKIFYLHINKLKTIIKIEITLLKPKFSAETFIKNSSFIKLHIITFILKPLHSNQIGNINIS